jgi:hypothetical protein
MSDPLCRFCGVPIRKKTTTVYFKTGGQDWQRGDNEHWRYLTVREMPKTQAQCQRLVGNGKVMSVRKTYDGKAISYCSVWDGAAYVDLFFCNGDHAKQFGYAAAQAGHAMPAYNKAKALEAVENATDAVRAQQEKT